MMWVFYLISMPLTLGMVLLTLKYFAGPYVPRYVLFTVGYTWFCSLSIIILVPADIWTVFEFLRLVCQPKRVGGLGVRRAVVPIIQGYEDAGDFTVAERLKTSVHVNLVFYLCVGSIGLFGLILLIILRKYRNVTILGFAMACSNTFGLVTGAFLLGFGLSEIPKGIWKNVDWTFRQKVLSQKVAKMAVKLDDAHQEFSNAIVVAQATSKQMSKRDPLRPYMNVIDNMLLQMFSEDPSFKPQGGRFGENDMDYDTDEKSMAALRLQIKRAREEYYRCKSEYMNFVMEALELEDTIKNYDRRHATGWKFISSFRPERAGALGSFLDMIELVYRCILRKQLEKVLAVILGCMSAAILLAEATILPSGVDLSLFSILINAVGKQEVLVQVAAFIPLMYMMVARYAPPISYNFLNLIRLGEKDEDKKTIFEKRMGNIDQAVPFFGNGFNKIYPLIMVIYTIMIASNFFDRIIDYFGNWKIFRFQSEADDIDDGFDPSGLMILQKERSWLDQGHKVGELVIPLARNFNDINMDLESSSNNKAHHQTSRESIARKYVAVRAQQSKQPITQNLTEKSRRASFNATFPDAGSSQNTTAGPSSRLSSTWESMKTGLQNLKSNMGAKKFLPLREIQDTKHSLVSSSESLDDIFQRLNQPNMNHRSYGGGDDYDDELDDHSINVRKLRSIG
ncbi:hypothetical protein HYC85_024462 [Camellia sinensis]|uniref:LMBR1-like membrane protein n=1 Tax=Camellia sinensis TaxID=4442 RepID=A0A7J7GCD4_CAMSI|nr:hypothetical protein HYC85_024462 [Camellia sinensis]